LSGKRPPVARGRTSGRRHRLGTALNEPARFVEGNAAPVAERDRDPLLGRAERELLPRDRAQKRGSGAFAAPGRVGVEDEDLAGRRARHPPGAGGDHHVVAGHEPPAPRRQRGVNLACHAFWRVGAIGADAADRLDVVVRRGPGVHEDDSNLGRMNVVLRIEVQSQHRRPIKDGYRASMSFGRRRRGIEPIVFDAVLVFEDSDAVAPGARAIARAYVFDVLPRHVEPVFTLLEGDRIVARAELLETLEDLSPQPLRDFDAAKRRQLSP